MPEYQRELHFNNSGSRNDVRMRVVHELSCEAPGTGIGADATRFTYYVETLSDGKRVYLRRPANLHWGFDFIVCVEGVNFNPFGRRRNYPTHPDIINDLQQKAFESCEKYRRLHEMMLQVYHCEEIDFSPANKIGFESGYPCDMILAVLKWLFIEQDIRYWNYSGRNMLWSGIAKIKV